MSPGDDALKFGLLVLAGSGAALLAVQSHRLTSRLRVPAPALFLLAAVLVVTLVPGVQPPPERVVERVVTVALLVILFDGGLHLGRRRLRGSLAPVLSLGLLGTFATVAGVAVLAHLLLGVNAYAAVLLATAVSPTDPAVVFSVLGQQEVEGRSGTILEGESGTNDPVGIALLTALIAAGSLSVGAVSQALGAFALQLAVGAAVGLVGGRLVLLLWRRLPLPGEGLYAVRVLVGAGTVFGLASVAHGSGFLAVFVAGIVLADEPAPYKVEVERFHAALASLAEIVAFFVLGLTVDVHVLARADVWGPGLVMGVLLTLVLRPLLAGPFLLPFLLPARGELAFVLLAGLKGAVPLLLGTLLRPLPGGERLYGVVVVVTVLSVVVQGAAVPTVARRLGLRLTRREPPGELVDPTLPPPLPEQG